MLKKNFVKSKLDAGLPVLGTWIVIPSCVTVDIISSAGLDFVIIDQEHGPISFEKAQEMAAVVEGNACSPIMRVGDINKAAIQSALDIGMHGIQVPNIECVNDAERVVDYARHPPTGSRGFSPFTRAGGYSIENSKSLIEVANKNTLIILNIEGIDAIKNIDGIVDQKEVDILFVGLFDLSKALGIPGEVEHPMLLKQMESIVARAARKGKAVGTITTSLERLEFFKSMGLRYLVHLVDCEMLRNSFSQVYKTFKEV